MQRSVGVRRRLLALAAVVLPLLTACPPDLSRDPAFAPDNRYGGPMPEGAASVSPADFAARVRSGALSVVTVDLAPRLAAERAQTFEEDLAALAAAEGSDTVDDVLANADDPNALGPEPTVDTGAGEVTLLGMPELAAAIVDALATAQDVENALADYRLSYELLPEASRAGLPVPSSLAGADLGTVQDALAALDAALSSVEDLDRVVYAPGSWSEASPTLSPQADAGATCDAPSNYFADFWFPLRNFVPPVKDQLNRGTCWAFAAIGAVEIRERVQNDNPVNLSEQFLVNQVKARWARSEFAEGYGAEAALHHAVDDSFGLPPESAWTFNQSASRMVVDGSSYRNSCVGYSEACSDTAHQSRLSCTVLAGFVYCAYDVHTYTGPSTPAGKTTQVWATGERFDLNRLRNYLANGHALIATFPVYAGFEEARITGGVISDYTRACYAKNPDKSCAGHVVLLVGFLSNEQLSQTPLPPVNAGGGGYFVLKNSWGCRVGDGGYYYVPADYVEQTFGALSVLDFDSRRGSGWRAETASPGSTEAPVITIKDDTVEADLRVPEDLASAFEISHSSAPRVRLTVTSDVSGVMFDGEYMYRPSGFVVPTLPLTFTVAGRHRVTLRARYGTSATASAALNVDVVNSAPEVALVTGDGPYEDTPFAVTALPTDINESSSAGLCQRMVWSASTAATVTGAGCQVTFTFAEQGPTRITARTADAEGRAGQASRDLMVMPPPPNPNPVVTSRGVRSRELQRLGSSFFCGSVDVPFGATIDLREDGCTLTGPTPVRYFAAVDVVNPDGEALLYDWVLYVTVQGNSGPEEIVLTQVPDSTQPVFDLRNNGNTAPATSPCRVAVTVKAPDPTRNKSLPSVWSGNCTYYALRVA